MPHDLHLNWVEIKMMRLDVSTLCWSYNGTVFDLDFTPDNEIHKPRQMNLFHVSFDLLGYE